MKKALATLVVTGTLALPPVGSQGAEPSAEFKGKLQLGLLIGEDPSSCSTQFYSCVLFAGTYSGVHPLNDPCFNTNQSLRKEIFGADPQGNPAEEAWGSRYPFLNIKDVSAYTTKEARTVKFTLDSSAGYRSVSLLYVHLLNTNCTRLSGFSLDIANQETLTKTIPKGAKWLVLYADDDVIGTQPRIHRDEAWHMAIL